MTYNFNLMHYVYDKLHKQFKKISIKSLFILLKKTQAVVQKTSRKNVTSTVLIFSSLLFFDGGHGWKNHSQLKRTALKQKKKKHMHNGIELEAR